MTNTIGINTNPVNYNFPSQELTVDDIVFNGFGLQNDNVVVNSTDWDTPEIRYTETPIPRGDGDIFISKFFGGRVFTLNLTIIGTGDTCTARELNFQQTLDNFKKKVLNVNKGLFKYRERDGQFREMLCTVTAIPISREHYNIVHQAFSITFNSVNGFWSNPQEESSVYTNVTTSPIQEEITPEGTAPAFPKVYFIFGNSGNTNITEVSWETTQYKITYNATTLGNDDILLFDSDPNVLETKLNDSVVDYTGAFPILLNTFNTINFNITSTSHNCTIAVVYKKNYH